MKRTRISTLTLVLLCGTATVVVGGLQEATRTTAEQPSFPGKVELVTVDVVVLDKQGRPVRGLGRDDFTIEEDGRVQHVEGFEAIELAEPSPVPPEPRARLRVSRNSVEGGTTGRVFVVVFDDNNLTLFAAERARSAVGTFLERAVRNGDRVMLVTTGGGTWWSTIMPDGREELLPLLENFVGRRVPDTSAERMEPWEAMRIHIYRDPEVAARVSRRYQRYGVTPNSDVGRDEYRFNFEDPFLLSQARRVYIETRSRMRLTHLVVERVLNALRSIRGRKSILLVSDGFIHDPNLEAEKRVEEAARRANGAIYFIDARGVTGAPLETMAEFEVQALEQDMGSLLLDSQFATEGSEQLASSSGGFSVKNTNDLAAGMEWIATESEAYYMLGYLPTNRARDGEYRKIEVKVNRKGARTRARRGYYAPSAEEREAADEAPGFQPALDSPFAWPAIPLRMGAYVFAEKMLGEATVLVAADVDIRELAFREVDGKFTDELEYLLVVAHSETGESFRYDEKVEMNFSPSTRAALNDDWYSVAKQLELASGAYQARFVVRDRNSGEIGSVIHEFDVPPLGEFRISSPVLTDRVQQAASGRPRPVLRLLRRYASDAVLYCEYEVYGAARSDTGMPRVTAGYTIQRDDGTTLTGVGPTSIRPGSLGKLSRFLAAPLAGAPAGEYELILSLRDEVAGTDLLVREPFEIAGPGAEAEDR